MTNRFAGTVVLISGVARGQGRSHAVRLAAEGADIIGFDICADIATNEYPLATLDDLEETRKLIESRDRRAVLVPADARDRNAVRDVVARGVADLGGLTHVVAQAGICPLGNEDPQAFVDVVDTNLGGVLNTVGAAIPHLKAGSAIVCTGSLAGLISGGTSRNAGGGLGYSWSKVTIASYVHDLAKVLAPKSIRVNAVHPTNTDTPMLQSPPMYRAFRPDLENPTAEDARLSFPALNAMPTPWVEPGDVSDAVLFLLSEQARWITGAQLPVDAGAYVKASSRPAR
ncbi:mycofactocin-coupled SDR family oxidoreductase [Sporichthya polymorpha]|uniref:mycofactocin-coupled SDR family oxidoreductase n=1 Tax=Sporichthya polymorpha TaxID=35751 RepID=UPI0005275756|nr:mycofactocin-coupled SDR family oxidoreductase [Sporichthya polymorpha]